MDELLGLHFGYDFDGEIEGAIVVPEVGEVLEAGEEEGRFEVFEEVHTLEIGDCAVGDGGWWGPVGGCAAGVGDDLGGLLSGEDEGGGGGGEEGEGGDGGGMHCY